MANAVLIIVSTSFYITVTYIYDYYIVLPIIGVVPLAVGRWKIINLLIKTPSRSFSCLYLLLINI